jgi:hypothetical protein
VRRVCSHRRGAVPPQPGDLCLILVDQVQEALDHLALRISEAKDKLLARS